MEFEIKTKDYEGDPLPNTSSHHRVYNYMKYMKQNIYMRYAQMPAYIKILERTF
mgnify:FL=1